MINPFVIEINREGALLKMGAFNASDSTRHFHEHEIQGEEIKELCRQMAEHLNQANMRGSINHDPFKKLKKTGERLFDELLSSDIKERLRRNSDSHLIINIDESLVSIPWELLFDGKEFLCLRYAMGRMVRTGQKPFSPGSPAEHLSERRLLILADPTGDLKKALDEGRRIKTLWERSSGSKPAITLKTSAISRQFVKENIRNYDMIHFAGHAVYEGSDPSESGWRLEDGRFSARDIGRLASTRSLPCFVFSNACETTEPGTGQIRLDFENRIYGLANAFLLGGVKYYIGTFRKIPDDSGHLFAGLFYKQLASGASVGEAVKHSRKALLKNSHSASTLAWASYILYGDPAGVLFRNRAKELLRAGEALMQRSTRYYAAATMLIAAAMIAYLSIKLYFSRP